MLTIGKANGRNYSKTAAQIEEFFFINFIKKKKKFTRNTKVFDTMAR